MTSSWAARRRLPAANSSSSANFSAFVGQASTQAGSWPALVRSMQRSHLTTALPSRESSITPNGQTIRQNLQPIHLSLSINTGSLAACLCIASVGQTVIHGASSQCLHWMGTPNSPAASTVTIRCGFGDSATASSSFFFIRIADLVPYPKSLFPGWWLGGKS